MWGRNRACVCVCVFVCVETEIKCGGCGHPPCTAGCG